VNFPALGDGGACSGAHRGVHAGRVTAARENCNSFHEPSVQAGTSREYRPNPDADLDRILPIRESGEGATRARTQNRSPSADCSTWTSSCTRAAWQHFGRRAAPDGRFGLKMAVFSFWAVARNLSHAWPEQTGTKPEIVRANKHQSSRIAYFFRPSLQMPGGRLAQIRMPDVTPRRDAGTGLVNKPGTGSKCRCLYR